MFAHAVQRHLSAPGVELVPDRYLASEKDAERINAECDSFALPLANAFRKSFLPHLVRYTRLIERLNIPVTVIGVGAQASIDAGLEELRPHADTVKAFARAVLDRSAVIGVRGAFTADYLKSLGFNDVEVIGCPSMYMHGRDFRVARRVERLTPSARIAVNITPNVPKTLPMALANLVRYPDTVYIPQDLETLRTMLWGERVGGAGAELYHQTQRFFAQEKAKFFVDPSTWMQFMKQRDFAYGTRIHGNMAALQAGTPACLIAHDSRTRELAQVLCIPFVRKEDVTSTTDIAELYEQLDFERTNREYPRLLENYIRFLDRNSVPHTLHDPSQNEEFDRNVAAAVLSPAVTTETRHEPAQMAERIDVLRARHHREVDGLRKKLLPAVDKLAKTSSRLAATEKRLAEAEAKLRQMEATIAELQVAQSQAPGRTG